MGELYETVDDEILLMTVLLTHCTKLEFDGFDPTTTTKMDYEKNDSRD